jgi:glutathione S-transferase
MAAGMILHFYDLLYPRKACAAAAYLQAPVTLQLVDVATGQHKSAEFLALNPNGLLPVLVDGPQVVWESNAILCYLAGKCQPDFWPMDARHTELIRWLSWDAAAFTNYASKLYFELYVRTRFDLGAPNAEAVAEAQQQFQGCAAVFNAHMANRDWVVGDAPTAADFALGASLPYSADIELPISNFPAIERWYERLSSLRGWKQPFDESNFLRCNDLE